MLDARFIAPTQAMKSEPLKTVLIEPSLRNQGRLYALADFDVKLIPIRDFQARAPNHSIGNDFLDFGGGNSRSRSARSSLVSLMSIDRALSRTCFSLLAFGIAITSG